MGFERYPRGNSQYGGEDNYYSRYDGTGPGQSYSSAREYEAAGMIGPRDRDDDSRDRNRSEFDRGYYSRGNADFAGSYNQPYRGGYGDDGRRFSNTGDRQDYGRDRERKQDTARRDPARDAGDYRYQERGFFNRAGDEVRSWFGDEEAERRRELDQRYDQRYDNARDGDYHNWRSGQIAALDRDYDEYRRENQQRFHSEFGSWRTERNTQRSSLERVAEHMDVVGSDGEHIGTVDKVRGDRIVLTKNDADAGGRHHSIPSRWIDRVDDKVTVRKTADEAKAHWRDEERSAFFGDDSAKRGDEGGNGDTDAQGRILNRSFSGTY